MATDRARALERWVVESAYVSLGIEKEANHSFLPLITSPQRDEQDAIEDDACDLLGCFATTKTEATIDIEAAFVAASGQVSTFPSIRRRLGGEAGFAKGSKEYPLCVEDPDAWDASFAEEVAALTRFLADESKSTAGGGGPHTSSSTTMRRPADSVDLTSSPDKKEPPSSLTAQSKPVASSTSLASVITNANGLPVKSLAAAGLNPSLLLQTHLGPKPAATGPFTTGMDSRADPTRRSVSPTPLPPAPTGFVTASSRFGIRSTDGNPHKQMVVSSENDGFSSSREPDDGNRSKPFRPPARAPPPGGPPALPNRNVRPGGNLPAPRAPAGKTGGPFTSAPPQEPEEPVHPRLKGLDPDLIERIENEILEQGQPVTMNDIAGLEFAKQTIEELVVWPIRNPELYTGLRRVPKGLLLFGPPGTGKTLIGKAIAHECQATFFSVSASTLTSKWIGEGEKMVRALFAVAAVKQPSVVFIDEIDSLLTQRTSDENEASRRIKTEFLVQFDGCASNSSDIVLVIGATNRPQELDEAARRRFVRRLYIPLPDEVTRVSLLTHLLTKNEHKLSGQEILEIGERTAGYSGADVTNLAQEASMGPIREMMRKPKADLATTANPSELRAISRRDFEVALRSVKASVSNTDLSLYEKWNAEFGSQALQASASALEGGSPSQRSVGARGTLTSP